MSCFQNISENLSGKNYCSEKQFLGQNVQGEAGYKAISASTGLELELWLSLAIKLVF